MHRKQYFPDTKVWPLQNVRNSVSTKHVQRGFSCTKVSSFFHHEHQKHPKMTFSVCFQYLCGQPVQNDLHLRKPIVSKVAYDAQDRTFPWQISATCREFAKIRLVPYRPSCYTPRRIQHESEKHISTGSGAKSEKHGEKRGFGVICLSMHKGPRWAVRCSNCKQSHALSTNNEVSMNHYCNVQNVHCCASRTAVLPLV